MKLPKTVNICGKTYDVHKDRKGDHGHGQTFKQKITIGVKEQSDERQFDTFLHEVAELIACEKNLRYGDGHSETSVFVMSHKEFEYFASALATAIMPMIKENVKDNKNDTKVKK